jgi:hypothetical protein
MSSIMARTMLSMQSSQESDSTASTGSMAEIADGMILAAKPTAAKESSAVHRFPSAISASSSTMSESNRTAVAPSRSFGAELTSLHASAK